MQEKAYPTFTGGLNLFVSPTQIKEDQLQVVENMEVRPTSIGDNLTFLALTARHSYKRLHTDNLAFVPKNLVEFVSRNTIGPITFTGAGLNDATFGGRYTGTGTSTFEVEIDGTGTPDTFKWRKGTGAYTTGVAITGSAQTLQEGITVTFGATTGHTLGNKWIITVLEEGTKFLVTGGFNFLLARFQLRYLKDGDTTTNLISQSVPGSDTGIATFVLFNQFLYYTDGVNTGWKKWDGITDSASAFATKTKFAIKHKNRIVYANDITNNKPNRIWISDVGQPETVGASNFFTIGDESDPIIGVLDQIERVLIIKERSTWAIYFAPTLTDSTILRADEWKGSLSPLGMLWGSFGTYVYTTEAGLQFVRGLVYKPTALQIYNFLKGFQNTLAALGHREDQLLVSTKSNSTQIRNDRIFAIDLLNENTPVYQYNLKFTCFCLNRGVLTFGRRLKACEDDGTNRFIVEMDQVSGTVETNISCVAQTKDEVFDTTSRVKKVEAIVIDALFPNTSNALTLKIFGDGVLKETLTFTPTATGYNRHKFHSLLHLSRGYRLSFRFEYTQPASNATRFALLSAVIHYAYEARAD